MARFQRSYGSVLVGARQGLVALAPVALTIQDATHAHAGDNIALTQHNILVIQDAAHSHAADNVVLGVSLVIQDAAHAHAADNVVLTQHNVLAVQDALHGHTAENLALTQHNVLAIQDALHGHAADNLVLTQHNVLVIQDALHAHAADNVVLTEGAGSTPLVIQDGAHADAAENVVLAQHNVLAIADATHAHRATDHWDGPINFDGTGVTTWTATTIQPYGLGSGDFWDVTDGGTIVYRALPSSGIVEQGITTPPSGGAGDTRSFMLRKSTAANSAFFCFHFDADYSHITVIWRDTDGAVAGYPGQNTGIAWNGTDSIRFRFEYDGTTAVAKVSLAGGAWQTVNSRAITGLSIVCLADGNNPSVHNATVYTRDPIQLMQHNVLAIADALHGHSAEHIVDIGGDPGTVTEQQVVRMRRRKMGAKT